MALFSRFAAALGAVAAMGLASAAAFAAPATISSPQQADARPYYLGQVATRTRTPWRLASASYPQFMSRTGHYARDNIPCLKVVLPNFIVDSTLSVAGSNGGEVGTGAAASATASIEYPAGTITRITFSGATTGTIANNNYLVSDWACPDGGIPNGAKFWIRWWGNFTAGGKGFPFGYRWPSAPVEMGDAFNWGTTTVTDLTGGGTVIDTAGPGWGSPPVAILGMTRQAAFALVGDSRVAGIEDVGDASGDYGETARTIGPNFAYINFGVPGQQAAFINNNPTGYGLEKAMITNYTTHIINELGVNDVVNSTPGATIKTYLENYAALFPGKPIWQTTLAPWSNTTDVCVTTANQTPASTESFRISINTLIRKGLTGYTGFIELADVFETSHDSGIWQVMTGGTALTGHLNDPMNVCVHENAYGAKRLQASGVINAAIGPVR